MENPDAVFQMIKSADYPQLLQFVQSAYSESKAENDEPLTQYAYTQALDQASGERAVRLAVDFALDQADLNIKYFGAQAILRAKLAGATIASDLRDQAITRLKDKLSALSGSGQLSYDFARSAANALVVWGDDAGLDVLLTSSAYVTTYSKIDGWTSSSPAALFETLKTKYQQKAQLPNQGNTEVQQITSYMYELCRLRRVGQIEIKVLHPLVDLEKLRP